jgi:hypothetical protein
MTATLLPERVARLPDLKLIAGHGKAPRGKVAPAGCVVDIAAWVAGEAWSDHPACVSPAIGAFCRSWNDALNDTDRQMLLPYAERIVGTADGPEVEERRAWLATDWLVRTFTSKWLRLAKLDEHAAAIEALPALTSTELANAALPIIRAARDAAGAAARAARDAARDAAWAAAWAAAGAALAPTVKELQASALDLLDRMVALHREVMVAA